MSSINNKVRILLMTTNVRNLIILLLGLILTNSINAQQVKISGVVTDIENKPLDFVSVSIEGSTSGDFTNSLGKYSISVTRGDSATVVFSLLGYQTTIRKLGKVTGDVTLNVIIQKKQNELDEVTITGQKKQIGTTQNIQIGNTNLAVDPTGGSVESIIMGQAGVSSTNELSTQYSVRGGNYDENIVYVNGIEIYRPLLIRSGQQEGLSFINPNLTGSVNFSSGGFDASYGDKMSSVLDIKYRQPKRFEAGVSGSLLGSNAYVGSQTGRFSQITGFRYKTTKSLLGTMDTNAEYAPTFVDAQTFMTFRLSSKWQVNFLGNISSNKYDFTPKSRETQFGTLSNARNFQVYFDGWEHDKFVTYFGALSLNADLNENLKIGFTGSTFSSREYERYDINAEYRLTDSNLDSNGVEGDNGNLLAVGKYTEHARNKLNADVVNIIHTGSLKEGKHTLRWGLTIQQEKIKNQISEWILRDSAGYSLPNTPGIVSVFSNLRGNTSTNTNRYSGYLQDTYQLISGENIIYITAGVRGSYWSFNKEFLFSPRASITYIPAGKENLTFRFATGIYYQSPFYKEYQKIETESNANIINLNNDIKSQKSIHLVLGGDYSFKAVGRPFKFTSELYYKKLSDLIPYTVNNVKIRYAGENISSGYTTGLDMKLFGEFVPGTDSWISFSLMKTQQTINEVKVPLPTDQRYNVSLYFQDYFPGMDRLTMNLRAHLSQGLPQAGPNSGYFDKGFLRAPAYKRLDIGFAWKALGSDFDIRNRSIFWGSFRNIWIGFDIFNLFDIQNTNSYYWITDVFGKQFGVPNYLTGRQLNARVTAEF